MTDKLTPQGEQLLKYLMNEAATYERIINTELDRITIEDEENAIIHLIGYDIIITNIGYHATHGHVCRTKRETVSTILQ
jgi:hypothetical protein